MPLPDYTAEELAELSPAKLTDIIIEDEDRVPRNVIDECAQRGVAMTEYLQQLHEDDFLWSLDDGLDDDGVWWLRLHAVMILGLIPSERAGLLLVELMRRMSLEEDDNLQGWLAGYWTALFRNKPESVQPALVKLCEDRMLDWYIRANAIEPVVDFAARQGGEMLEQAMAWLAGMAADEKEDWEFRLFASDELLDRPRAEYRPLLEDLAARQSGFGVHFSMDDVRHAYAEVSSRPKQNHRNDPWEFYKPEAITKRQQRWREEDARAAQRALAGETEDPDDFDLPDFDYPVFNDIEPYIRPEPKIGRNDPCPCGSGLKYKKCCGT